ncbi:hypothetical protein ElyMa_006303900 [Elysia marginata]|uniref:Uncharacterized protein n=1 Tax=Elysia marginata TaxID=1093978 RepID=A0AAV4HFH1_9GAST|nr:hypothetical protein ElyMa_006303900 [Elysia marginata]
MWINCFPKAVTTCVVVGIEPATAGSQVRRPNHRATLLHNKASGEDQIQSEILKYALPILDETVAYAFETHEALHINSGVLIAIQKHGKATGPPNNLRPTRFLNTIGKSLSITTFDRIRPP